MCTCILRVHHGRRSSRSNRAWSATCGTMKPPIHPAELGLIVMSIVKEGRPLWDCLDKYISNPQLAENLRNSTTSNHFPRAWSLGSFWVSFLRFTRPLNDLKRRQSQQESRGGNIKLPSGRKSVSEAWVQVYPLGLTLLRQYSQPCRHTSQWWDWVSWFCCIEGGPGIDQG